MHNSSKPLEMINNLPSHPHLPKKKDYKQIMTPRMKKDELEFLAASPQFVF